MRRLFFASLQRREGGRVACSTLANASAGLACEETRAAVSGAPPNAEAAASCNDKLSPSPPSLAPLVKRPTRLLPARRRVRCLRGAYHATRSVAQLLAYLLEPGTAPAGGATLRGACPLTSDLRQLGRGLEGVPLTLQHEGPLRDTHVLAIRDLASDAAVTRLRTHMFHGGLCPCIRTAHLWTPDVIRVYHDALIAARQARLDDGGAFNGYDHLKEAGVVSLSVFCDGIASRDPQLAEEWRRLIRSYTAFLPDRSHIHELENLPQEVAIGELLCEAVAAAAAPAEGGTGGGAALDCVVDVGGGNGFLAAQAAERLQCDGVIIDPFFPAHAIDCCPRLWPDTPHRTHAATRRRYTLHRTMALFRDVRWADVVPAVPARTALIAKHLCGSGVDEVLRHLEAQGCLPRILVLAPCCFNKISFDTYCNPAYLQQTMGIASEAGLARVHRLTDWNMSCYQSTHEALLTHGGRKRQRCSKDATPTCDDCDLAKASEANASQAFSYERRSGPRSIVNSITCTHAFARLVEGLLNYGRMSWLRSRGYKVQLVQYVPDVVTPKNMCLVAIRRSQLSEE